MRIGMTAVGIGKAARPQTIRAVAENADRLGFGTLWAPEHVVLFDEHQSKYPYSTDGRFLAGSTIDLLDPFIGLTYAAAYSKRIRLATGICLVPEHNPLVLAKTVGWGGMAIIGSPLPARNGPAKKRLLGSASCAR